MILGGATSEALLDALPHLVWVADPSGRLLYVNQAYADYVGGARELIVGGDCRSHVHPDEAKAARAVLASTFSSLGVLRLELRLRRHDGIYLWHMVRANPVFDEQDALVGYIGTDTDIDEEKRAAAKRSRTLAAIVESSVEGIVSFDLDGRITSFNPGAERLYGWREAEVLGRSIYEVMLPAASQETARAFLGRLHTQPRTEPFESQHRRRDGSEFPAMVSLAAVYDEREQPTGASVICRDVTRAKADEARVRSSLDEKEVLLMEVHHRVKNNMQIVCSLLSLQSHQARDPDTVDILTDMEARVRAIGLAHEKLYQAPDISRIDLAAHVRDIVQGLVHAFSMSRIGRPKVHFDLAETWVGVDTAIPVGLIVNELVTNALKYAFVGRTSGVLSLVLRADGERLYLDVGDDGIGMPPPAERRKGSLGLRLVTTLVRQLGGVLRQSEGGGTHFALTFGARRPRRTLEIRS